MPDLRHDFTDNTEMATAHAGHHNDLADAVNADLTGAQGPPGADGADGVAELTSPGGRVYRVVVDDDGVLSTELAVTITSITPDHGVILGGVDVVITGVGFAALADAGIGVTLGNAASGVAIDSDTQISAVSTWDTGGSAWGSNLVIVTHVDGTTIATGGDGVHYTGDIPEFSTMSAAPGDTITVPGVPAGSDIAEVAITPDVGEGVEYIAAATIDAGVLSFVLPVIPATDGPVATRFRFNALDDHITDPARGAWVDAPFEVLTAP